MEKKERTAVNLETLVSFCKRRGFFYQSSDIYGGINGIYDKGPLGVLFQKKIIHAWIKHMERSSFQMVEIDGALIGHHMMWKASGHVDGFHDPLVDCKSCKVRYRSDEIDLEKSCPRCGNKDWSDVRQFNMMFSTNVGAASDSSAVGYLRPETAQVIFVQFKNIITTNRVKIPFGVMQVGKSFRNEITPRQFLFRMREFNQMEMEFFCKPAEAISHFEFWLDYRKQFYTRLGFDESCIRVRNHEKDELSHYSSATSDFEFLFPFGWKELEGIAYRTDYDLSQHMKHSGKDMSIHDEETKQSYIPHVVECSVGLERLTLALLSHGYCEEQIATDTRTVLRIKPFLAPYTAAILPLTRNEESYAKKLYNDLIYADLAVSYDESGSIGKRYRRNDEIGTPLCITIDEQSLTDNTVTIRDRDSMEQYRLSINNIKDLIVKTAQYF
jgi:glycyl-tRNA synthetase